MLRCEMENQKNELKDASEQLDEAVDKADMFKHEMSQLKLTTHLDNHQELEKLKIVISGQEEEIIRVWGSRIFLPYVMGRAISLGMYSCYITNFFKNNLRF